MVKINTSFRINTLSLVLSFFNLMKVNFELIYKDYCAIKMKEEFIKAQTFIIYLPNTNFRVFYSFDNFSLISQRSGACPW